MNDEIEFLEYIYQNINISLESIKGLIKTRNKKDEIEEIVKKQYIDYKKISNSVKAMLERRKKKVEKVGVATKIATYVGIKINLLKDDSINETAIMLVEASKVEIEQITYNLKKYNIKNKNILNLISRLLDIERNNIKNLEKYIVNR